MEGSRCPNDAHSGGKVDAGRPESKKPTCRPSVAPAGGLLEGLEAGRVVVDRAPTGVSKNALLAGF
jgi:hypothetical protein